MKRISELRICVSCAVIYLMIIATYSCNGIHDIDPIIEPDPVEEFTGLPIMHLYLHEGDTIQSKEVYVDDIKVSLLNSRKNGNLEWDVDSLPAKIKGRGHFTWTQPKRPYRLKLKEKRSLQGMPSSKDWVLLANYTDKSSIRNATAFYMGSISNLDWTPRSCFVELFMNNEYQGQYQLTEKIKIAKERVNISKNGFLLEIDHPARLESTDISFKTERYTFVIQDPDLEEGSDDYNWIRTKINQIEDALFGEFFLDEIMGYRQFVDLQSFADWYIINEISKNSDANFFSSCYMNIEKDGKLKMGPIWDFDIAFGNNDNETLVNPEGFWVCEYGWYKRLFEDDEFKNLVRKRFDYFNSRRSDILNYIDITSNYLRRSAIENNNKWDILGKKIFPNYAAYGSYEDEVYFVRQFISKRMDWLDSNL